MMLDHDVRQRIILQQEGAVLASISSYATPVACEIARCQIDGIANALIRIDGAEETAQYIFALSDRVAVGCRSHTAYLPTCLMEGPVKLEQPSKQPQNLAQFAWGFLCGLAVMTMVTVLAWGRT